MALKFKQKHEILAQNCVFLLSAVTLAPNVHIIRTSWKLVPRTDIAKKEYHLDVVRG